MAIAGLDGGGPVSDQTCAAWESRVSTSGSSAWKIPLGGKRDCLRTDITSLRAGTVSRLCRHLRCRVIRPNALCGNGFRLGEPRSSGAGDRDRTGMASLEGLKTGYPRVPHSGSDLRVCNVILTVTPRGCPYVSVATDTIGTRETRFDRDGGGHRGRASHAGSAPSGDLPLDAGGCSCASFSSLPIRPLTQPVT